MGTQGSTKSPAIGPNNLGGPAMGGKMHGGGVKLDRKSIGKISDMQDSVLSGEQTKKEDNAMAKSGVISGSHSKGGFMKHAKSSYGHAKAQGYNDRQDESLGMKDGKESSKKQSMKDRRDEREGENKGQGNSPDGLSKYGGSHSKKKSPTKLKGGQVKLDKNKNGKIDGEDFKMMK